MQNFRRLRNFQNFRAFRGGGAWSDPPTLPLPSPRTEKARGVRISHLFKPHLCHPLPKGWGQHHTAPAVWEYTINPTPGQKSMEEPLTNFANCEGGERRQSRCQGQVGKDTVGSGTLGRTLGGVECHLLPRPQATCMQVHMKTQETSQGG